MRAIDRADGRTELLCLGRPRAAVSETAMNIHHLELFYYVARHGGISRAVRNMPYGIQQPAVSSQILQLEEGLGVKLFERNPFKLTHAGEELFGFVRPFFENLDSMARRLGKQAAPLLRIGASELALRDYLPAVIGRLRLLEPKLRLGLRSGFQAELERWLLDREIDLAITTLQGRPPATISCLRLVRLPLVLLVPRKSKIKSAAAILASRMVEEPLVCLPESEVMTQIFRKGLRDRRVDWPQSIEASSMDLVTRYVANGYGVGLSVNAAEVVRHPGVRVLPLEGFDPVEVAVLWKGEPAPLHRAFLEEARRYVAQQWPAWACREEPGHA
jgi:DNA-binding transcriptional LysR family regulator